jgi:type II secretory pathway component PulM
MSLILWFAGHRKMLLWGALAALAAALWLYVAHLRSEVDAARNTAVSLQKVLDDERAMAAGMAQLEADKAAAASQAASGQLVQKKREITATNSALKKEIEYVYVTKPTRPTTAENHGVGTDCAVFGDDFKRLWNAANTGAGGVPAPAAP